MNPDSLDINAAGGIDAVNVLLVELESWARGAIELLPNLIVAILVLLGFWLLARLARALAGRVMGRVSDYRQVNGLVSTIVYVLVLFLGVVVALGVLGTPTTVGALLGSAGIIGLALGFAFQDIAENFIAGVLLSVRRPFDEGDIVESNDHTGVVQRINLRATEMRTFQGQLVVIPNKEVFQNPIINYSRYRERRVDLGCGVAYGDDLERAREVAVGAVRQLDFVDKSRDVQLFYKEFGDSSINFDLRFWIDFEQQVDFLHAQSEAIISLKKAFDDAGVTIPFPIRTLDFGVVGGEKLSDVLPPSLYAQAGDGRSPSSTS